MRHKLLRRTGALLRLLLELAAEAEEAWTSDALDVWINSVLISVEMAPPRAPLADRLKALITLQEAPFSPPAAAPMGVSRHWVPAAAIVGAIGVSLSLGYRFDLLHRSTVLAQDIGRGAWSLWTTRIVEPLANIWASIR
jgi:hypothetical protein